MSLTTRLTIYLLAALSVVLVSAGLGLYSLTTIYLNRQLDDRLEAGLNILAASIESKPGGVEWEPAEHRVQLGDSSDEEQVRWEVRDDEDRIVAVSRNHGGAAWSEASADWAVRRRDVTSTETSSGQLETEGSRLYPRLQLAVGVSRRPMRATLINLAYALLLVGFVTWTVTALIGRWLCAQALTPVRAMAAGARSMQVDDLTQRLDEPRTNDELRELAAAFNGLLGRLEGAFERQRRFSGDAAHQLATPLTGLLGQVEVALRRPRTADEYCETLRQAQARALHMRQLIEALLFLARPDGDTLPPELETLDLSAWLPRQLQKWSEHPRVIDLQLHLPQRPVFVAVAANLLEQLLGNLLDNALKYSVTGTSVGVHLSAADGVVALDIEDQGTGIAAEDLPRIFEPFYRSTSARQAGKPGVGLGLAVAQRIALALGGKVTVLSAVGQGSRFTLTLPAS